MLTTGDVARELGVTINTVKSWIRAGKLDAVRLPSGHHRIPAEELERLRRRPRDPALAEAFRARREAFRRINEWEMAQPVEEHSMEWLLAWVASALELARAGGPLLEKSVEEAVEGVRELHRRLARARW